MTLHEEARIRRIAGRILASSGHWSAARHQMLIAAGRLALDGAEAEYDPRSPQSYRAYLKQRIHWAMFDALRSQNKRAA